MLMLTLVLVRWHNGEWPDVWNYETWKTYTWQLKRPEGKYET